jgi:hypothetical protein
MRIRTKNEIELNLNLKYLKFKFWKVMENNVYKKCMENPRKKNGYKISNK